MKIIIDPGHGGLDAGAISSFGLTEKAITLNIASMVQKILSNQQHEVILTRTKDTNLSLTTRSELCNHLHGDLYISIHANASLTPSKTARGIETFYVDFPISNPPTRDVGYLSLDIKNYQALKNIESTYFKKNTHASHILAHTLQTNLIKHVKKTHKTVNDRGIKTAPLRNLLRSIIPTAYVEVGFLSHHEEAQSLATEKYQKELAEGISHGILAFIQKYKSLSI